MQRRATSVPNKPKTNKSDMYSNVYEHGVITIQRQDGSDQLAHFLTTLEDEKQATVVQIDQNNVVQQEIVLGTQDVCLADEGTVHQLIQTIPASITFEEAGAYVNGRESLTNISATPQKDLVFLTNYREYNILDVEGRILIGEKEKFLSNACKIVPVTDVSTGYKFEYQFRPRGTVKRWEFKKTIVYFIGQVSNLSISCLLYQTVFQLATNLGTIDLDREYTSGKKVLSKYYQGMPNISTRTMRAPVDRKTYIKILLVGDVEKDIDDDLDVIQIGEDLVSTKPSEKLLKSKIFKPSRKKYRKSIKNESAETSHTLAPASVQTPKEVEDALINEMAPTKTSTEPPIQETQIEENKDLNENGANKQPREQEKENKKNEVPVQRTNIFFGGVRGQGKKIPKKRGRKPKSYYTENPLPPPKPKPQIIQRSSGRRAIKRPAKFDDYLDLRKRNRQDILSDEDDDFESLQASGEKDSPQVISDEVISQPPEYIQGDQTLSVPLVAENNVTSETVEQNGPCTTNSIVVRNVCSTSLEAAVTEYAGALGALPCENDNLLPEIPKKRGPGRPRKYPIPEGQLVTTGTSKSKSDLIDKLVLEKKKYPSCQFQKAQANLKNVCKSCLTNHENPVTNEEKEVCYIVNAKHIFTDQACAVGTGAPALMSLPTSLSVKVAPDTKKLKVCAGQDIPMYTQFGPLVGILLNEEDIQPETDLTHVWFLQQNEDGEKFFLYTGNENASNWCHYLEPVTPDMKYNMVMVLKEEGIFFTSSRRVYAGQELKVLIPFFGNKSRPSASMAQDECLHCKTSFKTSLDYQKHYHIFHPGGFTKQKQKCRICAKTFPSLKDIQKHMVDDHDGTGAFLCEECGSTFPNPARLRTHIRDVHPSPEAAVTCEKCGKVYRNKRALANHVTNAHSEFKFACEICGKWFDRRGTLLRHQRLHLGEYSHYCSRCGKGFRDNYNLKVHMLTHSGVRPFSCVYCQNVSFSNKGCLKNHYQGVHNLSVDAMPDLSRSVPFTLEAYSGNLEPVDKPVEPQPNLKSSRVGRPKAVVVSQVPMVDLNTIANSNAVTEKPSTPKKMPKRVHRLAQRSILRPTHKLEQKILPKLNEESGLQIIQNITDVNSAVDMPLLIEEVKGGFQEGMATEFIEAEQIEDGDHCYYALNVDGQRVLVPATEEVCVIVEDENTLAIPETENVAIDSPTEV